MLWLVVLLIRHLSHVILGQKWEPFEQERLNSALASSSAWI